MRALLTVVSMLLLSLGMCAVAQQGEYTVPWWTIDAGGITVASDQEGQILIGGTIGQYDAGDLLSRQFQLRAGFWYKVPVGCTPANGDVDGNGCVDDADLLQVLFAFGATGQDPADSNCDGTVDDADLLEVLFAFGTGC